MADLDMHIDMIAAAMAEQAKHLDALVAEVDRLRVVAEWANGAPHLPRCHVRLGDLDGLPGPCTCGRDEVLADG